MESFLVINFKTSEHQSSTLKKIACAIGKTCRKPLCLQCDCYHALSLTDRGKFNHARPQCTLIVQSQYKTYQTMGLLNKSCGSISLQWPPCRMQFIRKTCPCKVYPLKLHFYIVKLGYAGVYLFFLFLLQNIDCGYSLEPPCRGGSNVYPQSMF